MCVYEQLPLNASIAMHIGDLLHYFFVVPRDTTSSPSLLPTFCNLCSDVLRLCFLIEYADWVFGAVPGRLTWLS